MKLLRLALTIASVSLLVGGYAASQLAVFTGRTAEYATQIDRPPIRLLSLILLLSAVGLAFVPDRDEVDEP